MIIIISALAISIIILKLAPHWSMLLGLAIALAYPLSTEVQSKIKQLSSRSLQVSIVMMGASLNINNILQSGLSGILVTFISILLVFFTGLMLARPLKIPSPLSDLICAGTSICGGSAISALSPIVRASSLTMATSLGIVFVLNALSVFIFPPIGQYYALTQEQFGTWAALAIHDTSSVVAASQIFGETALRVGTTLKLTRALWIIPLTLLYSLLKKSDSKISIPWFILLFLVFSFVFSYTPQLDFLKPLLFYFTKAGLALTLFLIGLSLNKKQLQQVSLKPIIHGFVLWFLTAAGSLIYVLFYLRT